MAAVPGVHVSPPTGRDTRPREPFSVEHLVVDAASAHGRAVPDPASPVVWWFDLDGPALALGSRQSVDQVDPTHLVDAVVVRRRSGGGAVWLEPGAQLWVDVVVPVGDPRWRDDVRASMIVIGDAWRRALVASGLPEDRLEVHTGGVEGGPWSDVVCFAGIGPGEVTWDRRKLVGISQRRTRSAARFQCTVHRRWAPTRWVDAFARPDAIDADELPSSLPDVATLPRAIDDRTVVSALVAALDDAH